MLASWKKSYDKYRQHIKKQRYYFANKSPSSQSYGFPVVMYGCESWTIKLSVSELMLLTSLILNKLYNEDSNTDACMLTCVVLKRFIQLSS